MVSRKRENVVYVVILITAVAAAAFFLARQINQPLVADEPQFVDIARSLTDVVRPMAYAGSTWRAILTHPQLYHALLAVPVTLAGKVPWAARMIGILGYAGCAVLLWFIARGVTRERWGPLTAVVFYLWHPLSLQSALLVEIDTALLPLLTLAFVFYLQRRDFKLGKAGWFGLALLFGVTLCAKLTTPPLLIASLIVFYLFTWRPKSLLGLAPAIVVAAVLFVFYYIPYCAQRHLPVTMPFVHSFGRAALPSRDLAAVLAGRGAKLALWLGAPTIIVYVTAFAASARARFRHPSPAVGFALITSVVIAVFYLLIGGDGYGFVKYHAPIIPLIALAVGVMVGPALGRADWRVTAFLFGLAVAYHALIVRDPLYWPYTAKEAELVRLVALGDIRRALTLSIASVLLPLLAFVVMTRRGGWAQAFTILALGAAVALDGWHAFAPYEVRYNYGEAGQTDVIRVLRTVPKNRVILVPVDVAFNEGYRHEHVAVEDYLPDVNGFYSNLRDNRTGAVVLRDAYYLHEPYKAALEYDKSRNYLENIYSLQRFGSFVVGTRRFMSEEEPKADDASLYKPSEVFDRTPR